MTWNCPLVNFQLSTMITTFNVISLPLDLSFCTTATWQCFKMFPLSTFIYFYTKMISLLHLEWPLSILKWHHCNETQMIMITRSEWDFIPQSSDQLQTEGTFLNYHLGRVGLVGGIVTWFICISLESPPLSIWPNSTATVSIAFYVPLTTASGL